MIGIGIAERLELVGRARILEAAAGVHVGQDDNLFGAEDFRRLGHEPDPAERDDIGIGRGGLARQIEAVADEIGEVLYLRLLVIMGEDDRVAFLLEARDFGEQVDALQAHRLGGHYSLPRQRSATALVRNMHLPT